jgi:hypothetical protein
VTVARRAVKRLAWPSRGYLLAWRARLAMSIAWQKRRRADSSRPAWSGVAIHTFPTA